MEQSAEETLKDIVSTEKNKTLKEDPESEKRLLESLRSWTNGQILLFRMLVLTALITLGKSAFYNSSEEGFDYVQYFEIFLLLVVVYASFWFETKNNARDDERLQSKQDRKIKRAAQEFAMAYMFTKILPADELDLHDRVDLLKEIPAMIMAVSYQDIKSSLINTQELMADTMMTVTNSLKSDVKHVTHEVEAIKNLFVSKLENLVEGIGLKSTVPSAQIEDEIDSELAKLE